MDMPPGTFKIYNRGFLKVAALKRRKSLRKTIKEM